MTSRPARVPTRRLALALSLMLLAGSLALPAVAGEDPGIISPNDNDTLRRDQLLELRARAPEGDPVNWAVRFESAEPQGGSNNVIGGGPNVTAEDKRELVLVDGVYSLDVNISDGEKWKEGDYFFVFNWGDPGDEMTRESVPFSIDPLEGFEGKIEDCDEDEACSIDAEGDQTYTASTVSQAKEDQAARLGLRIAGAEDGVREAVFAACQDELADDQRLGGDVAHLVPVGFAGGSLTVTNFIPKSVIKEDVNRGTDAFQICIAPTAAEAEGYDAYFDKESGAPAIGGTGLVGPFLLDDCGDDSSKTACVESRERLPGADLEVTYRIPAVDPWMM